MPDYKKYHNIIIRDAHKREKNIDLLSIITSPLGGLAAGYHAYGKDKERPLNKYAYGTLGAGVFSAPGMTGEPVSEEERKRLAPRMAYDDERPHLYYYAYEQTKKNLSQRAERAKEEKRERKRELTKDEQSRNEHSIDDVAHEANYEDALDEFIENESFETFKGMISQFENPFLYIRELVQNSRDANAERIKISMEPTEYRVPGSKTLTYTAITVEDDGFGMDLHTIEHYFLNLFASSKEKDKKTIGRFGVGIASIFQQNPDLVLVETSADDDPSTGEKNNPLKLVIGKPELGAKTRITEPGEKSYFVQDDKKRTGTKISLLVNLKPSDRKKVEENLRRELIESCAYSPQAISFNGEVIHKDFDVDAPVKVQFGSRGLQGIMGLSGKSLVQVMNHRLVLTKTDSLTPATKGLEMLIDSRDISYTISRNGLIEDNKYRWVRRQVDKARIKLVREAFNYMENDNDMQERPYVVLNDERMLVWKFGLQYLAGDKQKEFRFAALNRFKKKTTAVSHAKKKLKTLDDAVLDAKIFTDFENNPVTPRQVLEAVKKQKRIYISDKCTLAEEAKTAGLFVLKRHSFYTTRAYKEGEVSGEQMQYAMLNQLGTVEYLSAAFHSSKEKSRQSLEDRQRDFLEDVNAALREIPELQKVIHNIEFGSNFAAARERADKTFVTSEKQKSIAESQLPYASAQHSNLSTYSKNTPWAKMNGYGSSGKKLNQDRSFKARWDRLVKGLRASDTMLLNPKHPYITEMVDSEGEEREDRIRELLHLFATEKMLHNPKLSAPLLRAYGGVSDE